MSSNQSDNDAPPKQPKSEFSSDELTNCLLSQYRFTAAGVGLGTAYALRYKKGFGPMVVAGAAGTTADLLYGYLVECAQFRDE